MRIALGIEYEGQHDYGWQKQVGVATLQQHLEFALGRVANQPIRIYCAGRTDKGVHATAQVVHFDSDIQRPYSAWTKGVNCYLPRHVSVNWAMEVSEDFHARFSASARRYCYLIYNNRQRPGIYHSYLTWEFKPLNVDRMHEAAQVLVGQHDFSSFRAAECQAHSPIRTIKHITIASQGRLIYVDIKADGFLYHMVRNIMGVLISIGREEKPISWLKEVLDAKKRSAAYNMAAANGLYLVQVEYPNEFGLPCHVQWPLLSGLIE